MDPVAASSAVPLKEIKDAIDFLVKNGFLELDPSGAVRPPEKYIECRGSVFRVALTKFHRDIFELAAKSIENTPNTERDIQGHTFAISTENYVKAQAILDEAVRQVRELGENERNADCVYHMEVALFPLTTTGKNARKDEK